MRKITLEACQAFFDRKPFRCDNTQVEIRCYSYDYSTVMLLHGNEIARKVGKQITLTLAGWPTVTTRDRLNGILQYAGIAERFRQHKNKQYFGEDEVSIRASVVVTTA
jgi:hypothetical protein